MKPFKRGDIIYRVLAAYIEAENMQNVLYVVIDKGKISVMIGSGIETLVTYRVVKNIYTSHKEGLILPGNYDQDRLSNFSHTPLKAKKMFVRQAFEGRKD